MSYKNDKNVEFEVHTDTRGKDHINVYNGNPREEHTSIHINWDSSTGTGNIVDTTSGTKETTDVKCFLTTACMKHFDENFDDNCYQLEILRWFRDKFVSQEDIAYYYEVAPLLIEKIEEDEHKDDVYQVIYDQVIKVCVNDIEDEYFSVAYKIYRNCIRALEQQYLKPDLQKRLIKSLKNIQK